MIMGGSEQKCRHTQVKMYHGYLESYQYLVFERSYHFQSNMLSSISDLTHIAAGTPDLFRKSCLKDVSSFWNLGNAGVSCLWGYVGPITPMEMTVRISYILTTAKYFNN